MKTAVVILNWNTKDFPKPKAPSDDIPLQWTNPDASEGYVTMPGTKESARQEGEGDRKFYTIRANNEEFQKFLDKEYEKLRSAQRESAAGQRGGRTEETIVPGSYRRAGRDDADSALRDMILAGTKDSDDLPAPLPSYRDQEPVAPAVRGGDMFDINYLDQTIKQISRNSIASDDHMNITKASSQYPVKIRRADSKVSGHVQAR